MALSRIAAELADSLRDRRAFTAATLLSTLRGLLPSSADGQIAVDVARSLQAALCLHDVGWRGTRIDERTPEDVLYTFADDFELPTGVVTAVLPCYSPLCRMHGGRGCCYSYDCPLRAQRVKPPAPDESARNLHKLQNQLDELLDGEQSYYDDLCLVETAFAEPLRTSEPPIIPRSRLAAFLSDVLLNMDSIRARSGHFLDALRRLKAQGADANALGEIVERAVLDWGPAYHEYTTRFPLADYRLRQEMTDNPAFRDFLERFHDTPKACKRGFDTFHSRPTFRALRYILLLENILAHSSAAGVRPASIERALVVLRHQGFEADREIERTKRSVAMRDLDRSLVFRETATENLDLTSPRRLLLHSGPINWRSSSGDIRPGFAFLFDHFLVLSKPPRLDRESRTRYIVKRRPVPLALVRLEPAARRDAPHEELRRGQLVAAGSAGPYRQRPTGQLYPVEYRQLGHAAGRVTFFVESPDSQDGWYRAISDALDLRAPAYVSPFRVLAFPAVEDDITATLPLQVADRELLLAGGRRGVYVAWADRVCSLRRVLHLAGVTHLWPGPGGFLLVLADGVLLAYPLDVLLPPDGAGTLSDAEHGRFKITQTYSVTSASPAQRVDILQGRVALFYRHHVDVMDLSTLRTMTIPDFLPVAPSDVLPLMRMCEEFTVLGLFRVDERHHLLVFERMAFFVESWGSPLSRVLFTWESHPERAFVKGSRI
ncbi:hypothetical protein JCM3774_002990, partial [Rhodotorula dairenensis]